MSNCIKILIHRNIELFETILRFLSKLDLNFETSISSGEYFIVIKNQREICRDTIDYVLLINTEIDDVENYFDKIGLLITNNCNININSLYCIENTDTYYLTGLLLSLLGIPLEYTLERINREYWNSILKGYIDSLYKQLSIETKRIETSMEEST